MSSQGTVANLKGKDLEDTVETMIKSNGYVKCDYTPSEGYLEGRKCYMTNVPYTSIYKKKGRTEFVIIDDNNKVTPDYQLFEGLGRFNRKMDYH